MSDDDYLFKSEITEEVELTEDDVKVAIHKALNGLRNKQKEDFVFQLIDALDGQIPYNTLINIIEQIGYDVR